MQTYEHIIGLSNGNGPGSATLEQHCSAMRMDKSYSFLFNRFNEAITNTQRP